MAEKCSGTKPSPIEFGRRTWLKSESLSKCDMSRRRAHQLRRDTSAYAHTLSADCSPTVCNCLFRLANVQFISIELADEMAASRRLANCSTRCDSFVSGAISLTAEPQIHTCDISRNYAKKLHVLFAPNGSAAKDTIRLSECVCVICLFAQEVVVLFVLHRDFIPHNKQNTRSASVAVAHSVCDVC